MSNLKLGVDIVRAHNLLPRDGDGSSNAYVELFFDGQKLRSTTKEKDLNPVWNESFYFNISDCARLNRLTLYAYIYSTVTATNNRSFLGKVSVSSASFLPLSDAVVLHYPLEKRRIFSRVRGVLGLKVYITDDPNIRSSRPLPATDVPHEDLIATVVNFTPNAGTAENGRLRDRSHHLPNTNDQANKQPSPATEMPHKDHVPQHDHGSNLGVDQMKGKSHPLKLATRQSDSSAQPADYALKGTSPFQGGGQVVGGCLIRGDKMSSAYDLIEQMHFLYVRVVKARELQAMDPYVEVKVGNYKGVTKYFEKKQNPEWNEVYAFSREHVQSSVLDVVVKDKDTLKDDFVGIVRFEIDEVPQRVPPNSPLAPEWYRLEDKNKKKINGEVMLAVWVGTQADEAFPGAWHSDTITPIGATPIYPSSVRSKVYHAPRLWYVSVNILEAGDLVSSEKNRFPNVHVKAKIGNQVMQTKTIQARSFNPLLNEDLLLVAAEPFEDPLILSVEEQVDPGNDKTIGRVIIHLSEMEKRADDRIINCRWFNLEKPEAMDVDQTKKAKFSSKILLRVCLDGGYHVFDEVSAYCSDLRPTDKQLWKPSIGVLELGILNAVELLPVKARDGRGTSDTYCVAKYGHQWVRTRTILDSPNPKYNEQYAWEVFDRATVLTVGIFDNGELGNKRPNGNKNLRIGKVRIRISTLEPGRVYKHSYPLLVLQPTGVKKMGELRLAIRFSCTSLTNLLFTYSQPLLPMMHYVRPLRMKQLDMCRQQAVTIVVERFSRAEPPLQKEVVEYMYDVGSCLWSIRKSKANFFRLMGIFSRLFAVARWFGEICKWRNPTTTLLVHVLFLMLVCCSELILPTIFLFMSLVGVWNFRYRPLHPACMDAKLSQAEEALPEELDEEFDTFPTSRDADIVRERYDRLRSIAGRLQTMAGDMATQGERFLALLSWRDPCATAIFVTFCLVTALVLYTTPFRIVVALAGLFLMRHPWFRRNRPSVPTSFFQRLPTRRDYML